MKIGCCGWSYLNPKKFGIKNWKEKFKSKLQCYSSLFDLVEVNSTFYRFPKTSTVEKWRREVPENFEFTVKANQIITHVDQFKTKKSILAFEKTVEIAKVLKANYILIQTPKSLKESKKIEKFFERIKWNGKIIVELRGLQKEIIKDLCEKFGLIHCVDPFAQKPVTKKFYYFRLHGKPPGKKMYYYKYKIEDFKKIKWPKNSYVLFNNVYMYESAMLFKKFQVARHKKNH